MKMLLERGDVNPDSQDESGRTPLSHAAGFGNESVVNILLERGDSNPDLSDEDGRTPLSYAGESGHEGVVKILLERKDVNPDSSDKSRRAPSVRNGAVRPSWGWTVGDGVWRSRPVFFKSCPTPYGQRPLPPPSPAVRQGIK